MGQHVCLQATRKVEPFVADFASVWLLSGVYQFVPFQMSGTRKLLVAHFASVHL